VRLGVGKSGNPTRNQQIMCSEFERRGMGQSRTALALILCNLSAYLTRRFIFASLDASHGLAIYGDL